MLEQVPWQVAIVAGVVPAVRADGAVAPAVVRHHGVSYGAAGEERLTLLTGCCCDPPLPRNIHVASVFFLDVASQWMNFPEIKNVHPWLARLFRKRVPKKIHEISPL